MPPGKRRQSNAMLYTLVTFVALFVIATTAAVIYYVRAEDLRTKNKDSEQKLKDLASADEQRRVGDIVGEKMSGQSYLGTMNGYMEKLVGMVMDKPLPTSTVQVKVTKDIPRTIGPLIAQAQAQGAISLPASKPADANAADPNKPAQAAAAEPSLPSLTSVVSGLLNAHKQATTERDSLQASLKKTQDDFKTKTEEWAKTKETLNTDVEAYRKELEKAKADYAALKEDVNKTTTEQMANLDKTLKDEQKKAQQLAEELTRTKSDLTLAQARLKDSTAEISKTQPSPDNMVAAQKADGVILSVDTAAGTVIINLGSEDRVYPGLTFSVYDRFTGIGKDGKSKAEVEVFAIDSKFSRARVLSSDVRNPIAANDLAANLIWDSKKQNQFVIAGDFDLDGDGRPDPDAIDKIKSLIQKWGGLVTDSVSSKTDFVILADAPSVPRQPTPNDLQADPMLRERYDAAKKRLDQYTQIKQQAEGFYIPVLNYERFLYFAGYKTESTRPGAF
jgi:hypothetical protein